MNLKPLYHLLLVFFCLSTSAQTVKLQPFKLKGQLKNFGAKVLYVNFYNESTTPADTIHIDDYGNFDYETNKITAPARLLLSNRKFLFYANLLAAPGYDFTITADCKDETTVNTSKKITGRGVEGSMYLLKIDSLAKVNHHDIDIKLELKEFLSRHNILKKVKDSVWRVVYGSKKTGDKSYIFFKEMNRLDNLFYRLDMLTYRMTDATITYQQAVEFIKKNGEANVLADIYNPYYLMSPRYNSMMIDGYYMYLRALKEKQGIKFNRIYTYGNHIKIIADNYRGEIREKALTIVIRDAIANARSFEEINNTRAVITPLLPQLKNKRNSEEFALILNSKEKDLLNSQIGKQAPQFTATDLNGKQLSISAYKGRVVLIDLWASWCTPCRAQTPYIERLVQKYKNDERLAVISVGVLDEPAKWRTAVETDKPSWLQLYDTDKSVEKLYTAYSIPKFIIVNKEGNIVSFDAPMPSDANALEKLLIAEMVK